MRLFQLIIQVENWDEWTGAEKNCDGGSNAEEGYEDTAAQGNVRDKMSAQSELLEATTSRRSKNILK